MDAAESLAERDRSPAHRGAAPGMRRSIAAVHGAARLRRSVRLRGLALIVSFRS